MSANLGSSTTSVHKEPLPVEAHGVAAPVVESSAHTHLSPSESLENIIRAVNLLLINLSARKLNSLYKLFDLIDKEHEEAVAAHVGTYRDRTVFWIQMATCGLQGFSAVATVAPQLCPPAADGINSLTNGLFGIRPINLTRFLEKNAAGEMIYNFNEVAKAAHEVLSVPPQVTQALAGLSEQSTKGNQTEKQSLMERLSAILGQRRQECTQEIAKEEEARRNYQQAVQKEDQVRQSIATR